MNFNLTNTTTIAYQYANQSTQIFPNFYVPTYELSALTIIFFVLSMFTISSRQHDGYADAMPAIICLAGLYMLSIFSMSILVFAGIATLVMIADEFGHEKGGGAAHR